jgi:hypothetical protein
MQSTDSETPARSAADTILSLGSSRATGLTSAEATLRLNRDGSNALVCSLGPNDVIKSMLITRLWTPAAAAVGAGRC